MNEENDKKPFLNEILKIRPEFKNNNEKLQIIPTPDIKENYIPTKIPDFEIEDGLLGPVVVFPDFWDHDLPLRSTLQEMEEAVNNKGAAAGLPPEAIEAFHEVLPDVRRKVQEMIKLAEKDPLQFGKPVSEV